MPSAEDCRDGLRESGARRAAAEQLRAEAMLDLVGWMRAARANGISVADIARLAGVTRATVYALTET